MSEFADAAGPFRPAARHHLSRRQFARTPAEESAVERARTTMTDEWGEMLITGLEQGPLDGSACAVWVTASAG
jgi:hypothetical protein